MLHKLASPRYQREFPHTATHDHADFLLADDVVLFRTDSFFRFLIYLYHFDD
jgi:hypothetical protein